MHFASDPDGSKGISGKLWHGECARPYWDTLTPMLERLNGWIARGSFGSGADEPGPELSQS